MPRAVTTYTLRLHLPDGLSIDKQIPRTGRLRELKRLERAAEVMNEHVGFDAASAELVEAES